MKPAGRPFELKQNEKSMQRYRQFMKRCLTYCVRTARLGRETAGAQYGIRWTDRQWTSIQQVVEELEALGPVELPPVTRRVTAREEMEETDERDEDEDAEREMRDEEEDAGPLDEAVFTYCIALLQQQVAFNVYVNPLLHFAAVLGIDDTRGSWREAKHYTASLAALVWCGRMLLLEEVFHDSPEDPNDITTDMVTQFKDAQQRWLADGSHTPFSTMTSWMAYGKGHRTKEGGTAKIMWEDTGQVMRYLGQSINIVDLITAANTAVMDLEETMDELIWGSWAELASTVTLRRIEDSFIYEGTGCSFATDPRNAWLRPGFRFLAERAQRRLWTSRGQGQGRPTPVVTRVTAWLKRLKVWKRSLMVVMHIWGGQPGRGPEITTLKHCDTQQVPRNVFVFDGQVMMITDRDKNRSIRGLGRKVARCFPERVGRLIIAYIAWLVPFEDFLYTVSGLTAPSTSLWTYMWKDVRKGAWETEQLTDGLAALTGEHVGVELTVADYRHVAIGLAREIKGIIVKQQEVEVGEGGDGDEDEILEGYAPKWEWIWDTQATHGTVIAAGHYAVDVRFPNHLQPEKLARFREISQLWHRFLEGERRSVVVDTPKTSQTLTTPQTLKTSQKSWLGSQTRSLKRRRASTLTVADQRRDSSPWKRVKSESPETKWVQDIPSALEQLLGRGATWRLSEQGEAMVKIMGLQGDESLIVVLPTGAGKSVLFMLPALVESWGTNIVVVPFAALMDDLVKRARESRIDCLRWRPGRFGQRERPMRVARLVVASADMEEVGQFQEYVGSLRDRKLLRRIFVDEAHTVIMDVSYRQKLGALKGLHRYGCPVIALTATLPEVMMRWFRESMLMTTSGIIRAATVKRNVRYRVVRVTSANKKTPGGVRVAVQDEVVRVVLRLEKGMQGQQKGVVYCRSRLGCEELAAKLGCGFYHSGIVDEGARRLALQRWVHGAGDNRWITATTGLGTGVDIKGIVSVVHMEQPYGLVDFVQQTGRGGRQMGEVVESVVVMDQHPAWMRPGQSDVEHLNHQAMEWFVASSGCRRLAVGMVMDVGLDEGGRNCEQLQVEPCDRCRVGLGQEEEEAAEEMEDDGEEVENGEEMDHGEELEDGDAEEVGDSSSSSGVEEGDRYEADHARRSDGLQEHIKEKHVRLGQLWQWLVTVGERCPVCWVQWIRNGATGAWRSQTEHGLRDCGRFNHEEYRTWRKQVDFGEYDCCWEWCVAAELLSGMGGRWRV